VFAISGENYRVLNTFTGDGSTTTFLTSTRGEFNLDSTSSDMYITIDGVPTTAYTTTTAANTITVIFDSAPRQVLTYRLPDSTNPQHLQEVMQV
jgi:hypothetical protein